MAARGDATIGQRSGDSPGSGSGVNTVHTARRILINDRQALGVPPARVSIEVLTVLTDIRMTAPSSSLAVLTGVAEVWIGC